MLRKYIAVFCLAVLSVAGLTGCAAPAADTKDYKIALICKSQDSYWNSVKRAALDAEEEMGVTVLYEAPEREDVAQQKTMIQQAVSDGYDAILIAPVEDTMTDDLRKATEQGLAVLTIDSDVSYAGRSCFIGTINRAAAEAAARFTGDCVTKGDTVGIIMHDVGSMTAIDRTNGFVNGLYQYYANPEEYQGKSDTAYAALRETVLLFREKNGSYTNTNTNENGVYLYAKSLLNEDGLLTDDFSSLTIISKQEFLHDLFSVLNDKVQQDAAAEHSVNTVTDNTVDTYISRLKKSDTVKTEDVSFINQAWDDVVNERPEEEEVPSYDVSADMTFPSFEMIHVHEPIDCGGDIDASKNAVLSLYEQDPELDVVYTTNQPGTIGACQAVSKLILDGKIKAGDIQVVGFDYFDGITEYIESGILKGCIAQNPYNMGYLGVRNAIHILDGENVSEIMDTGTTMITADTLYDEDVQFLLHVGEDLN